MPLHHMPLSDGSGVATVIVTAVLGVANIVQATINRRLDTRNQDLENERKADLDRVDGIIKERQELYAENKVLRQDLRAEIERLKDDVRSARNDSEMWEKKYAQEVMTNATLRAENDQFRSDILSLRNEVASLKARIDNIQPAPAA